MNEIYCEKCKKKVKKDYLKCTFCGKIECVKCFRKALKKWRKLAKKKSIYSFDLSPFDCECQRRDEKK